MLVERQHKRKMAVVPYSLTLLMLLLSVADGALPTYAQKQRTLGEQIEETGFFQSIRLEGQKPLLRKQSKYQLIEVHKSSYYGKILVLDGVVQLTERDGDAYNEMMAHIPLFQHPNPKRVLVIGGGDGFVLSEVLKHESVELVDHVDLDGEVIEVCRQHFAWGHVWDDPRVRLHITDGAAFVRKAKTNFYDVIIQDSSDPWTWDDNGDKVVLPSSALYSKSHFENIHRVLAPGGILNLQAESLQIPSDLEGAIKWREVALEVGFHSARYCSIMISSYPTGQIGCLLCEKAEPVSDLYRHIQERFAKIQRDGRGTTYYHPKLQSSAFDLPLWAEQLIYGDNRESSPLCADGHVLTE